MTPPNKVDKADDFMTQEDNAELLQPELNGEEEVRDETEAPKEERTFDNKTVQLIVKRERNKAYEKGMRDKAMQMQQEMQPEQAAEQAPQGQQQSLGGMPQMSQEQMRQLMAQEMPHHLEQYVNKVKNDQAVESFVQKMRAAEERFPGLEAKLEKYDYSHGNGMADIILAANNLENTADIIKEITDNPNKMANLLILAKQQPYAMQEAMQKLSGSIKQNQVAQEAEQVSKDPMSRLKPSANAGADNGAMSVADFRKMFSR